MIDGLTIWQFVSLVVLAGVFSAWLNRISPMVIRKLKAKEFQADTIECDVIKAKCFELIDDTTTKSRAVLTSTEGEAVLVMIDHDGKVIWKAP